MISYQEDNNRFNYRMAGICIHNGKVLLHKLESDKYWTLPGGRSELQEDTRTTVAREFKEETGYAVEVGRPIFFVENFFEHKGHDWHEVSVYYDVQFPQDSPCLNQEVFYGTEGNLTIVFQWFNLSETPDLPIFPAFLKERLHNIPDSLERVVQKDAILA